MDFVSDQLYNGKRFRTITALDAFSWERLTTIRINQSKASKCEALQKKQGPRQLTKWIKVKNRLELISRALDA